MLLTVAGSHARMPAERGPPRSWTLNRQARGHQAISRPGADIDPRPGIRGHVIAETLRANVWHCDGRSPVLRFAGPASSGRYLTGSGSPLCQEAARTGVLG